MKFRTPLIAIALFLGLATVIWLRSGPCDGRCVVVLDPGHGGDESGASDHGVVERDSNLDMALRVEAILKHDGIGVVLTRRTAARAGGADLPTDAATFMDLQTRVAKARSAHANVVVSIHSNSWTDPSTRGLDVWYDSARDQAAANPLLASSLLAEVQSALIGAGHAVPDNGVRDDTTLVDAAGHTSPLFVLGATREVSVDELAQRGIDPKTIGLRAGQGYQTASVDAPAALIELLYISNEADAALLKDDGARQAMAEGIARGIERYVTASHGRTTAARTSATPQ